MSGDLSSLVTRLESVTSRLEKVAAGGGAPSGDNDDDFGNFLSLFLKRCSLHY